MTLEQLNALTTDQAYATFESCCCAPNWVNAMVMARPFKSKDDLIKQANLIWQTMKESDYLAAFEGHPQIGNVASLRAKYANTGLLASHEQASMQNANFDVIETMAELNQIYLKRFGFIFIVFASGKSASEMLAIIERRLPNNRLTELTIAAGEQAKITQLRLENLIGEM